MGFSQAFQKRALPRALMTDNGSAMLAAETTQGLTRLSILHETTLPYAALPEREAGGLLEPNRRPACYPCSKESLI